MKNLVMIAVVVVVLVSACTQSRFTYPQTKKLDQVDEYFGTKVADPYRWLEDDRSAETEAWVKAQNEVTFGYLNAIPFRNKLKTRLEEVWNYEKRTAPFTVSGNEFFFKNDGLQNQSVLYIKKNGAKSAEVLLDPNKLSDDGTVALARGLYKVSKDGKYLAYGISKSGSDWNEIYVLNIETGEKMVDQLEWVKFSGIAWFKNGFFYSRYDAPERGKEYSNANSYHKVYYHKVGTSQAEDELIYSNKKFPKRNYSAQVTSDEKYLILSETESTNGNSLYIKNLTKNEDAFIKLTRGFTYDYSVIDHINDQLLVVTNYKAPKYKLVGMNMNTLEVGDWKTIIPETSSVLKSADLCGDYIIANYITDAHSKVKIHSIVNDQESDLDLPGIGTVAGIETIKDKPEFYYTYTSYVNPSTIFKYNIEDKTQEVYFKSDVKFDSDAFEVKQVFYKSKDGTKVPMFIVAKKGIQLNGNNPCMLYGYGGFNISLTPYFSPKIVALLENGGVYAVANLRGGGEYGEKWHKAGAQYNKQNVFDDFISAAEYLIDKKYTSSEKLAIHGGSNGGLLVGAVTNQKPGLFKVAIPAVGVMDMLRFQNFTIGWAWVNEYGSSADSTQFLNLMKYSPLHNVKMNVEYPAVMVLTADHDDRVVPAHSFKYIATLQEKYEGKNPVMIRIQSKAGHGAGTPTSVKIEEAADIWAFMFDNMGVVPK